MRTCFFTDVEHLRHAIQGLFPEAFPASLFTAGPYLPPGAEWENIFKFLARECGKKGEFRARWIRAYWYVTEEITPFPLVPLPEQAEDADLARWIVNNRRGLGRFRLSDSPDGARALALADAVKRGDIAPQATALSPENRQNALAVVGELRRRLRRAKDVFERQQQAQNDIARGCRSIEFRRSGSTMFDLMENRCTGEKTVDANLSLDMLLLKDIYDVAVILSGDQDFVPAARAAKNAGKIVVNVAFRTENGRGFFPPGADKLHQVVDWRIEVDHAAFRKFLGLADKPARP